MSGLELTVTAHWDAETGGWWAGSGDIPGLVTEATTFEELVARVMEIAPELIELNHLSGQDVEVPIQFLADRHERLLVQR